MNPMSLTPTNVVDDHFAVTLRETEYLQEILSSGDRAGFYLTYASMIAFREDTIIPVDQRPVMH